jgi:hypothetical protein
MGVGELKHWDHRRGEGWAHLLINTGNRIRGLLFPNQVLVDL